MRFYTKQHQFYCGVDLHADAMYVCILDATGEIVLHKNIPTRPKSFLRLIKPFRERSTEKNRTKPIQTEKKEPNITFLYYIA